MSVRESHRFYAQVTRKVFQHRSQHQLGREPKPSAEHPSAKSRLADLLALSQSQADRDFGLVSRYSYEPSHALRCGSSDINSGAGSIDFGRNK
jgi:hypothetical protein